MQATLDAFSLKGKPGPCDEKGNVKNYTPLVFAKALNCLSKYGDELSIYATSDFLSFSATNSSKSAYCRFKYDRPFFSRYRLGVSQTKNVDSSNEGHELQNVTGQLMTKVMPEVAFLKYSSLRVF